MNYRLTGAEGLIEATLERIAKRKQMELEGKARKATAAEVKRAAIRKEIERRQEARMVAREMAEVWDVWLSLRCLLSPPR